VSADINEEVVFDKHPIFGKGGIDLTPLQEGSCVKSPYTKTYKFVMTPTQYEENFTNLFTNDQTSVNINVFLRLQPQKGKTPILLRDFGVDWYRNSLQEIVREIVRKKLSSFSMLELVANRTIYDKAKTEIQQEIEAYVKTINLPIEVISFVVSKVEPPEEIRNELNTLSQEKAKEQTQKQRLKTEEARLVVNKAQAEAEAVLYRGMGFTPAQYIEYLRALALQNRSDIIRVENIK
jgi:regulator of protease activity HflC (stomatin/prohibitin superfamily)